MKKLHHWVLALACAATAYAQGNIDTGNVNAEFVVQPQQEEAKQGPFKLVTTFDAIGKSDFNDPKLPGQHTSYSEADIEARLIVHYDENTREGMDVGIAYNVSKIRWNDNPYYDKPNFHTATLSVGWFSLRYDEWFVNAQANMNVDTDHVDFFEYVTWDLFFVSRYAQREDLGIYLGLIAQTGMKMDRLYPIIGFDWRINEKWLVNAIFPVNISVVYNYNCNLTLAVVGRAFDSRHRFGRSEELSRGLIRYTNTGGEFALTWENAWLTANAHAGYTFGGKIRISNQHNQHSHRYRFDGAGYVGGELVIRL